MDVSLCQLWEEAIKSKTFSLDPQQHLHMDTDPGWTSIGERLAHISKTICPIYSIFGRSVDLRGT